MRTFHFDGRSSRDLLLVNKVVRSVLPPITVQKTTIPRRPGSFPFHSVLEEREISVEVTLMFNDDIELRDNIRELASWLYTEENKELYFNDEPNRIYKARLSGGTDLEEFASMGEGTLVFECHDPFAYALWEKSIVLNNVISNVNLLTFWKQYNDKWTNWYNNLAISKITFPSGVEGTRAELVAHSTNPRMRTVTSPDNVASLEAGKTYTASIVFNARSELVRVEFFNLYYYDLGLWQEFPAQLVADLEIENDEDGTRIIKQTFVADNTGNVRLSFGFGLGNDTVNGSYYEMKSIKIEEGDTATPNNEENVKTLGAEVVNEGTYKTFPVIRFVPYSNIDYFHVRKTDTQQTVKVSGVTFTAWVPFIIDFNTNRVYYERTGESLMKTIELESEFFELVPGENTLTYLMMNAGSILDSSGISVRATYKERYL